MCWEIDGCIHTFPSNGSWWDCNIQLHSQLLPVLSTVYVTSFCIKFVCICAAFYFPYTLSSILNKYPEVEKHVVLICLNNECLTCSFEYLHCQIQSWKLSIILGNSHAVFSVQSHSTATFLLNPRLFILFSKFLGRTFVLSAKNLNKRYQTIFTTIFMKDSSNKVVRENFFLFRVTKRKKKPKDWSWGY